ncbi:MAG: hypothetical protein L6Q35_14595 [Phycisphaerales bacterium]|nr:hypothetical protein [Phycisphaerales bacterium]
MSSPPSNAAKKVSRLHSGESELVRLARSELKQIASKARKLGDEPWAPFFLRLHGELGPTYRGTPLIRPEVPDPLHPELRPNETLFVTFGDERLRAGPVWDLHSRIDVVFGDEADGRGWSLFEDLAKLASEPVAVVPWPWTQSPSRTELSSGRSWLEWFIRFGEQAWVTGVVIHNFVMPLMHPDRLDRLKKQGMRVLLAMGSAYRKPPPRYELVEPDMFTCLALVLDWLAEFRPAEQNVLSSAARVATGRKVLNRPIPVCKAAEQIGDQNLLRRLRKADAIIDELANPKTVELDDLCRCFPELKRGLEEWADKCFPRA